MSFKNYVPIALDTKINQELSKDMVFYEDTNHEYEGKAKEIGDKVKILNAGKPTIQTFNDGKLHEITPEEMQGSSIMLPIDHTSEFSFYVGDIDKAIAAGNLFSTYLQEAKEGLQDEIDTFIASFAADSNANINAKSTAVSASNVLGYIDECVDELYANNVKASTQIVISASPKFCRLVKTAYRNLDTDNHGLLANGLMGTYDGKKLKMTNNVYRAKESNVEWEYIQIKTQRAIAFAKPYVHTEPYRKNEKWEDIINGYVLYGGVLARPKEMVTLKVKY